jgi:extracellular factor (EF) 3-hydroxypalmitic acid methyl ester biosynthesis protein
LTRNQVVFEVYNPFSLVQLSEVLKALRIYRGERAIYDGRAVVSNLVPTGLMVIVSATLVDSWSDLSGLLPHQGLREEVEVFVRSWSASSELEPSFLVLVSKARSFLLDLSRWLEQVDVAAQDGDCLADPGQTMEFVREVEVPVTPLCDELFEELEEVAKIIDPEAVHAHQSFLRKELHPVTLCAPFLNRTFSKPLGYAGDYEMVNMMLRDPYDGANTYARLVNALCLRRGAVIAHRNRIDMLFERLVREARRTAGDGRELRVLNIGCGPAIEVQRLMRQDALGDACDMTLIDFSLETLDYARAQIGEAAREGGRNPKIEFVHKSIHELLKESSRRRAEPDRHYDFVYCAGLFDYLSDRVCKRLVRLFHRWLAPGGFLTLTNVHARNPARAFMEYLADWFLVYRDEDGMRDLAPEGTVPEVSCDSTGLNIFLDIRKSAG